MNSTLTVLSFSSHNCPVAISCNFLTQTLNPTEDPLGRKEASEPENEGCIWFNKLLEIKQTDLGYAAATSPVFLSSILIDMELAFSN